MELERKPTPQISPQPVAVGVGEEAIAASMQKAPLKRVSRRAGRKMNEHRVGLENHVMRTLTGFDTGKLPSRRKRAKRSAARVRRSIGRMFAEGNL